MTTPSYFDAYENLAMTRDGNGVLTVRFHTDGGPIVFTGRTHEDFPKPVAELAAGRIWTRKEIEEWARRTGRFTRKNKRR